MELTWSIARGTGCVCHPGPEGTAVDAGREGGPGLRARDARRDRDLVTADVGPGHARRGFSGR